VAVPSGAVIPALVSLLAQHQKVTSYAFEGGVMRVGPDAAALPSRLIVIPPVATSCEPEAIALGSARDRHAAAVAALRARLFDAPVRPALREVLERERALTRCLEGATLTSIGTSGHAAAAGALAHHLVTMMPERRDPRRARAIARRHADVIDPARSIVHPQLGTAPLPCDRIGPDILVYRCGWVALMSGDLDRAEIAFRSAAGASDRGLASAGRGGLAQVAIARREVRLPEVERGRETEAALLVAGALRARGRLEESARILRDVAAARPPGPARCVLLSAAARTLADQADHAGTVDLLEAILTDVRSGRATSCAGDLEHAFRSIATQWHVEGRKTRDPATAAAAFRAYATFLEQFPRSPYAEDLRFYLAELVWDVSDDPLERAAAYEAVLDMTPVGRFARESVRPVFIALRDHAPAGAMEPSVADRWRRALAHAARLLEDDEVAELRAAAGAAFLRGGLAVEGAGLLAPAIARAPGTYGGLVPMTIDALNGAGEYGALAAFLSALPPALSNDVDEHLIPLAKAKACETRSDRRACYETLAAEHPSSAIAERAAVLAGL
jgi:hypothetical protein